MRGIPTAKVRGIAGLRLPRVGLGPRARTETLIRVFPENEGFRGRPGWPNASGWEEPTASHPLASF